MASQNTEIHTEEIALFSRPPVNVAEDRISWHEVRPSYMSNAEYSSINFSIMGNSSQYVKLSDSELYVKIRIEKEDGTPFATKDDSNQALPIAQRESGTPVDFILHSMWSSVDIKLNNNLVNVRPSFKLDVGNGTYLQGLNSLYKITGKTMENSDIGITREMYQQGYTLIGFDVDPTTSPDFRYVGKPREGHTKLEIRFKNGLPAPVTVILHATFPEIMTIDQARNVRLEIKDKFAQRRERR